MRHKDAGDEEEERDEKEGVPCPRGHRERRGRYGWGARAEGTRRSDLAQRHDRSICILHVVELLVREGQSLQAGKGGGASAARNFERGRNGASAEGGAYGVIAIRRPEDQEQGGDGDGGAGRGSYPKNRRMCVCDVGTEGQRRRGRTERLTSWPAPT